MGDIVQTRNYSGKQKWVIGKIIECTGPISVKVKLEDGKIVRRHYDQLLKSCEQLSSTYGVLDEPDLPRVETEAEESPVAELSGRYLSRNRRPRERYTPEC